MHAPESGRLARKLSQLETIPSDWRVPQTRSTEVGINWYFSLERLSSGRIFAYISDILWWNWRGSSHTSPFSEPPSTQAEMAQQGACPKPYRQPSLSLASLEKRKRKKWSRKKDRTQTRENEIQPKALSAQRWSLTWLKHAVKDESLPKRKP